MELLILLVVVIIVCGVLCYCVDLAPIPGPPFKNVLKILIILIGLLVVVNRTGLLHG